MKLMSTKTAIILEIIFIIFVFSVGFYFFRTKYQKFYENIPELSVVLENGQEVKMLPVEYEWKYKDETKEYKEDSYYSKDYKFPEEYVAFVPTTLNPFSIGDLNKENPNFKTNVKYRTKFFNLTTSRIENNGSVDNTSNYTYRDISSLLNKGKIAFKNNNYLVGEYKHLVHIIYKGQGYAKYALSTISFKEDTARIAKNYLNTSLEDDSKTKDLLSKIDFSNYLKDVSLNGKNLNLKYQYFINEHSLTMNNLILFACIPELESITYTAVNNNVMGQNSENGEAVIEKKENVVFTREAVNSKNAANTENLLKYMESL